MGHKTKKISKLQERLNRNTFGKYQPIERPFQCSVVNHGVETIADYTLYDLLQNTGNDYIACMNESLAHAVDHEGAFVISLCSPRDTTDLNNAGMRIHYRAPAPEEDRSATIAKATKIAAILTRHSPKKIHVYCDTGEDSLAFTKAIARLSNTYEHYSLARGEKPDPLVIFEKPGDVDVTTPAGKLGHSLAVCAVHLFCK